jgi:twitching motility protein PilT
MESTYPVDIDALLKIAVEQRGSDLHLVPAAPPIVRIDGKMTPLEFPVLKPDDVQNLLYSSLAPSQIKTLEETLELDFTHSIAGLARFRGNVIHQRGTLAVVYRVVPFRIPELDQLSLPADLKRICNLNKGLILVTGPTGAGKSTTLAAMIDYINRTRPVNIVTVEDPIEYLHPHKMATVRQREIGIDTLSFANALRQVLRHDPDIIMIGEMRDLESIQTAITAAETGHLVFSTLHTQTAPLTISRIIDSFPDTQKAQIRIQLANTLVSVISQQLVPMIKGGRTAAVEYMTATSAIRAQIRENKEHQLYGTIQTSANIGMQTMDQALINLVLQRKISPETAKSFCVDSVEFERLLKTSGLY